MSTVTDRVAAGTAFLDEKVPDWWTRISLDHLVMDLGCACVLGQVFNAEAKAAHSSNGYMYIFETFLMMSVARAIDLGFEADSVEIRTAGGSWAADRDEADYTQLAAEWTRVIITRRQDSLASGGAA